MKKIILSLIAVMATMSINAQVVKVYDTKTSTTEPVATYTNSSEHTYKVVFEETPAVPREYVEIGGLKWATMNLGATTVAGSPSTCFGDYYAWGETEPRYTSITFSDANTASFGGWSGSHSGGYSSDDYPTYTGSTLDATHDAATKNWGSSWRTPTSTDFLTLLKACTGTTSAQTISELSTADPTGGIYWLPSDQTYLSDYTGVAGILCVDKTDPSKRVFFPAAGNCDQTRFINSALNGIYWSSSLNTSYNDYARSLFFNSSTVEQSDGNLRYTGFPVRPVSGNITLVTSITLDNESLSIEVGKTETLTPTVNPADATTQTVTWTSSNTDIATVSSEGVVTAVAPGTAIITATANDASGVKATCEVTVPHEYVEIGGLKWATMNLGATTVAGSPATCFGDYYAWGETEPRYTSMNISGAHSATFGGWKNGHESGYSDSDYPEYTGTTLDADHDAATQNWGSTWRTPTDADFQALVEACTGSKSSQTISALSTADPVGGIYWLTSDQTYLSDYSGVAGILCVDKTDTSKRVFFPAAGNCYKDLFNNTTLTGLYWSSLLNTTDSNYADHLTFDLDDISLNGGNSRFSGNTVRPVSE